MKIGKGVEWAAHACAILGLLPAGWALSREALAEFLGVPDPYLAKQLQALSRAGLVNSLRGAAGGYSLAHAPEKLSMWDILAALEGAEPSFQCTEIRRNGPCGLAVEECDRPCSIAAAFHRAEAGFRSSLSAVSLAQVMGAAAEAISERGKQEVEQWLMLNATRPAKVY